MRDRLEIYFKGSSGECTPNLIGDAYLNQYTVQTIIKSHPEKAKIDNSHSNGKDSDKDVPAWIFYYTLLPLDFQKPVVDTIPSSGHCTSPSVQPGICAGTESGSSSSSTVCCQNIDSDNGREGEKTLQIHEEKSLLNLLAGLSETRPFNGSSQEKDLNRQPSSSSTCHSGGNSINYDTNDAMHSTFKILQESTKAVSRGRQRGGDSKIAKEEETEESPKEMLERVDAVSTPVYNNGPLTDEALREKNEHDASKGTKFRIFGFIEEAQMRNGGKKLPPKRKASFDGSTGNFHKCSSSYHQGCGMKCDNENSCNGQDNSSCSQSLGSLDTVETSRVKSTCEEDNYVNFRSDRLGEEASGLSAPVPYKAIDTKEAREKLHSSAEKLPSRTSKKSRITPIFVAPLGSDAYV